MSDTSPILGLPYIMPSQAQKHVTHNEAIQTLDALVQLVAISRTQTTPPGSPALGACYVVASGASDAWAGQDASIAIWRGSVWDFIAPLAGWQVNVLDDGEPVVFDGTGWMPHSLDLQNLPGVGIGTSYDGFNPLSVSGDATLLTHDGTGHQLKINKAGVSDTASLLFQDNFSGRAEMGLAGDDNFQIKVSPDGSSFLTALSILASNGIINAPCITSGSIMVMPDTVNTITPPCKSGIILILNVANAVGSTDAAKLGHSGLFLFNTGATPDCVPIFTGADAENHITTPLTGTTSTADTTGFSAQTDAIQIENRLVTDKQYSYTILGGI